MGREGDHGLWSLGWRRLVSLPTLTATNMPEMTLASMSQVVRHDGACFLTESHTEDAGSKVALGDGVYGRGIRRAKLAYARFSQDWVKTTLETRRVVSLKGEGGEGRTGEGTGRGESSLGTRRGAVSGGRNHFGDKAG